MKKSVNAVAWFEIPVRDFERARAFYSAIYGYDMPESSNNGTRMGFLPCDFQAGGVGGTIILADGYEPSDQGTLVYLAAGDDLQFVLDRVEPAGGKVLREKTRISAEIGYYAEILDTEGNRLALHSRA